MKTEKGEKSSSQWSEAEESLFEQTVMACTDSFWEKLSSEIVGKSLSEIKIHFVERGFSILKDSSSGGGGPYTFNDSPSAGAPSLFIESSSLGGLSLFDDSSANGVSLSDNLSSTDQAESSSKCYENWTVEEHRLFLLGLNECGHGSWKRIASEYVKSRTSAQVTSHAQKYFKRLELSSNKLCRRSSINDITSLGDGVKITGVEPAGNLVHPPAPQGPSRKRGRPSRQPPALARNSMIGVPVSASASVGAHVPTQVLEEQGVEHARSPSPQPTSEEIGERDRSPLLQPTSEAVGERDRSPSPQPTSEPVRECDRSPSPQTTLEPAGEHDRSLLSQPTLEPVRECSRSSSPRPAPCSEVALSSRGL